MIYILDKDHTWMRVLQRKWVKFWGRRNLRLNIFTISDLRNFTVKLARLGRRKRMQLDNHQDLGFVVICDVEELFFTTTRYLEGMNL